MPIGLKDLVSISGENAIEELKECKFRIACDVTNPLCGKRGCSAVFGPQKGATPKMIEEMDVSLRTICGFIKKSLSRCG